MSRTVSIRKGKANARSRYNYENQKPFQGLIDRRFAKSYGGAKGKSWLRTLKRVNGSGSSGH